MESKQLENLELEEQALVQQSMEARELAYCIYSNFKVGAALRLADGSVITGCNVENSSYGLTICAERTAIVKAVSEGRAVKTLEAVAVSAASKAQIVAPCGACRQVLGEFNPNVKVYLHNAENGTVGITNLNFLLPACFNFEAEMNCQS
ncbi:unnamed protein product [Allacma fusca]|uniref:Cytidine deaminase n=1 Tax=Allacma fusca TaxID=39272 RepID=A0A8J2LN99_9HEXA|nr:unnamed protein product [Allacma fusca]